MAGYETISGPLAIRYNTQGPVPEGLLGRLLINGEEIARPASLRGEHVVEGLPRGTHELAWRLYAGADLVDEARTTIHVVNDPPRPGVDGFRAFRDQSLTLAADRSVLANDSDHENDPLSVQLHEAPQHGSLDLASDGSLVYLPAAGFTGLDRFSYEVSDGQAGSVQHATILVSEVHTDGIIGGWTNFGGNAVHTGRLSATLGTRRPVERWRRSYIQLQPVAVDDGRVVVTSGKQDLQVLDPITGAEVWSYAFDRANSLNPPSVADGTIYVQRGNHVTDSQLWAVDLRNGTRRWSSPFTAQWQRYLAPTVTDGRIYVNGGRNGGMYGFDVDGSELFFTALAYDQWTPAYAEGRVYSWAAGKFAEHDATTGAIGRQVDLGWTWSGYSMNTAPVISGGTAYLRGNGVLHAVDLQSFEERWQLTGTFHGTPAADAGQIVAYRDQDLLVLDVNSGAILGQVALGAWGWHQPIVTDDVIFAATAGEVILLDRADLGEIARLPRGGHICLADNALYVASTGTNELICYELRPAPNDPPVAVIASPLDASVHETGSAIGFSGSGEDPEDGSLGSAALSWTSSLDGFLGTGVSLESSALSSGNHVIVLTATDSQGANASAQVTISVVEPDPPPSGDGSISREVWLGVAGNHISSIPLDRAPDISDELTVFETPSNWADGYGTRVRGYLTAPESGSYAFWIASDDEGELWLSSDEDPAGRQLIAQVGGWTSSREWNKYASQRSAAITLSAGQRYYIEALHKEGGGGDNLAIGWLRPGETGSVPSEVIPGALLSPFIASDPEPPVDDGTLPVGYGAVDLGSTLPPGASSHQDGEWTVDGAGADIWGTADGFHFVHRELFGDGSITARVLSQQDTNAWAKAGVMIREQLAADSRHAMMVVTPGNGTAFQYRTGIGSSSTHASGSMVGAPYWVRVVRRGDTLDGYESSDGSSWRLVGSTTLAMDEAAFIGLGVTSHSNGTLSRAVFDQLSVVSSLDADG